MKKILILIFSSLFLTSIASAGPGINVGIGQNFGAFTGSATETEKDDKDSEDAAAAVSWTSLFVEKTLGERLAIGVNYVPSALESETTETQRRDKTTTDAQTVRTQKISVDFEDLMTIYVALNVSENMFVKAGMLSVDVVTNETLGTGSEYADTSMDGTLLGLGYNKPFGNSGFLRFEGNYYSFDGSDEITSSTNSDNKVKIDSLDGASATISIGRTF